MKCITKKEYKHKKRKRIIVVFTVIFAVILSLVLYFDLYVNPIILTANKGVIKSKTIDIINTSVEQTISTSIYDELINITYDSSGNITLITANSVLANQLNTQIVRSCQDSLDDINNLNFSVPLGTFTGIPLFNGIGPNINIKMVPIGNIQTQFKSEFTSAGINQTYHKIYLDIKAEVSVLLPCSNQSVLVTTQILIGESVIIGEVPQVYLGSSNLTNQLNLVP